MSKITDRFEAQDSQGVSMLYLVNVFKRFWKLLVAGAVVVALVFCLFSKLCITPKYASDVSLYVTNNTTSSNTGNIDYNDIYASQKLVDTYTIILGHYSSMEQVVNKLHTKMSVSQLKSVVSFSSVNETEIIKITAVTSDPELSAEICNIYGDIAPAVLQRVVKAGSVEIIGEARPASSPSSPNILINTIFGFFVGLALALVAAFIIHFLDNTVQSNEEFKEKVDIPVWASIPSFNKKSNNKKKRDTFEIRRSLLGIKTPFVVKEAYKAARTSMSFAVNNGPVRTVVISSCEPDAGKSTTCTNLAITMAKTNAKVLVVDADLRKPIQHKYFRLENEKGLSGVLAGHYPISECIYEVATNLFVMPSGVLPPNPSELLASENMNKLVKVLSSEYDYIFFDAPPAGVVTDAVILAPKTDGMLFIVRQNQSEYPEIRKVFEDVERTDGKIVGAIITDVRDYNTFGTVKYKAYDYKYGSTTSDKE